MSEVAAMVTWNTMNTLLFACRWQQPHQQCFLPNFSTAFSQDIAAFGFGIKLKQIKKEMSPQMLPLALVESWHPACNLCSAGMLGSS